MGPMDEFLLGARVGLCCWRIRLRPERPNPWSWSYMMGLLDRERGQRHSQSGGEQFKLLRVPKLWTRGASPAPPSGEANLVRLSCSAAATLASNENRMRDLDLSWGLSEVSAMLAKFPVLLFLGIWRLGASAPWSLSSRP